MAEGEGICDGVHRRVEYLRGQRRTDHTMCGAYHKHVLLCICTLLPLRLWDAVELTDEGASSLVVGTTLLIFWRIRLESYRDAEQIARHDADVAESESGVGGWSVFVLGRAFAKFVGRSKGLNGLWAPGRLRCSIASLIWEQLFCRRG